MDAICENRWNLPKVLALAKENMCCVWVQHRGRMQGVEEDDEKFKEDFKILNFLWFSILFGNTIFSFHSHPLFIISSPVFLKGLGNLKRNWTFFFFFSRKSKWSGVSKVIFSSTSQRSSNKEYSIYCKCWKLSLVHGSQLGAEPLGSAAWS